MQDETPIIDLDSLNKRIKDFGFIPIEVSFMSKTEKIYLDIDLDSFLTLASTFEQKHIFFEYFVYEKEDYLIPSNWYEDQPSDYQKKVQEHNDLVDEIDFFLPCMLIIFIIKDGNLIGITLHDSWLETLDILDAKNAIEEIEFNFRPQNKAKKEEDEREMREIILNDPEFIYCKNIELRYEYIRDFIEKEEYKKFLYLVTTRGKAKMFMDKTWSLYKEKIKDYK